LDPSMAFVVDGQTRSKSCKRGSEANYEGFIARFSTWRRLRNVAALVARFLRAVDKKGRFPGDSGGRTFQVPTNRRSELVCSYSEVSIRICNADFDLGEKLLFRRVQRLFFYDKKGYMAKYGLQSFRSGALQGLNTFVDQDGIIRLRGRLQNAELGPEEMHPIILPGRSWLTRLVIEQAHRSMDHVGAEWVMGELRKRFYLVPGIISVKSVISSCVNCRKVNPRPLEAIQAPYHENRLKQGSFPFSQVGVDHFGPIDVLPTAGAQKYEKRWGVMFFCLSTRAVHQEVVERADVESLIMAFSRFASFRGTPDDVYWDLGRSNVALSEELNRMVEKERELLGRRLLDMGINFHFNPKATPHWGGNYERAIRTSKKCMKHAISGVKRLTVEILSTILARVTEIMNKRPIAWGQDGIPLRPADLLYPFDKTRPFPAASSYYTQFKKVQEAVQRFWWKWRTLYLNQLSAKTMIRRQMSQRKDGSPILKVGDIVLVRRPSPNVFTQAWEYARVEEVHANPHDGQIRLVKVFISRTDHREEESLELTTGNVSLLESVNDF
jgi:hypothetical protein